MNSLPAFFSFVMEFVKQPTVLSTVGSLGVHGVLFTALNLSATPPPNPETFKTIEVVELSPVEMQRLPAFAQADLAPGAGSLLPGLPLPQGVPAPDRSLDLEALANLGSQSLAQAPQPLTPFPSYNWNNFLPPPPPIDSSQLPPPVSLNPIPSTSRRVTLPPPPTLPADPPPPASLPSVNPLENLEDLPESPSPDAPTPEPSPGAEALGGGEVVGAVPTDPEGEVPTPPGSGDSESPPGAQGVPPEDPWAVYRDRYGRRSLITLDPGAAGSALGEIQGGEAKLQIQRLTLAFPDPLCPEDAEEAWIVAKVDGDGTVIIPPELIKATGYDALDRAAEARIRHQGLPTPGSLTLYQYVITFEDQGECQPQP